MLPVLVELLDRIRARKVDPVGLAALRLERERVDELARRSVQRMRGERLRLRVALLLFRCCVVCVIGSGVCIRLR